MDGALNDAVARLLSTLSDELFISHSEIARRTGFSQSFISKLLRCERRIKIDHLSAICGALGMSPGAVVAAAFEASKK